MGRGAENALELIRLGRLSQRQSATYETVHVERTYKLRHYAGVESGRAAPCLLVPPLMLTAEIYDISPELSTVSLLVGRGIDVWVVDFGAPERETGGMLRTLDDHVRAVADAVSRVRRATGREVHVGGYSQGGMFAYQAAALSRCDGIKSLVTFGSPVDIHRNIPQLSSDVTARMIRAARPFVEPVLERIEGLPGVLTATGFKVFSFRKELRQLADFVSSLHDREALERQEQRRRFLAGEGFVAWPGPALLKFVDDFIVHNRMITGGFVIDGRTVSLADVSCPVLCFVGTRDEIARPASVRAIRDAAPRAELYEVPLPAGHFGLVVGSLAMRDTWPTVSDWIAWREGNGAPPKLLGPVAPVVDETPEVEDAAFDAPLDVELFYDTLKHTVSSGFKRVMDAVEDAGHTLDGLRYQLPRLEKLQRMRDDTLVSTARALSEQAEHTPDGTFFLWQERAFTYAEANRRVDALVKGLIFCGVRRAMKVGVLMEGRPSYLSAVTALSRLGAIAVLSSPHVDDADLPRALSIEPLNFLITDPENAERARRAYKGRVLVLGGGPNRKLIDGVIDIEAIDPNATELPKWFERDPGRASDTAAILVTVRAGLRRRAVISNRRWAFSALGAAAACTLRPNDTVYCCLPLHHPSGLFVAVGGALVGGSRLSLATRFDANTFWTDVRRYGATVVFYAGEMCRDLVDAPPSPVERASPVRLFAGSGMRADVWKRVVDRFGAGVLEFFAATESSIVLANGSGRKVGSVGRPLPGSAEIALFAWDVSFSDLVRNTKGKPELAAVGEPGVLVARVDPKSSAIPIEPDARARIVRDVFDEGDSWLPTAELMRRDADGDHYLVDRLSDVIHTPRGTLFSRALEDAMYELTEIRAVAAYGVPTGEGELAVATVEVRAGSQLDRARLTAHFAAPSRHERFRPDIVRVVKKLPMSDGFRPLKDALRIDGLGSAERTLLWDPALREFV